MSNINKGDLMNGRYADMILGAILFIGLTIFGAYSIYQIVYANPIENQQKKFAEEWDIAFEHEFKTTRYTA